LLSVEERIEPKTILRTLITKIKSCASRLANNSNGEPSHEEVRAWVDKRLSVINERGKSLIVDRRTPQTSWMFLEKIFSARAFFEDSAHGAEEITEK
jgi:hypothetical protein